MDGLVWPDNATCLLILDNVDPAYISQGDDSRAHDVEQYLTTASAWLEQLGAPQQLGIVNENQARTIFESRYRRKHGKPRAVDGLSVIKSDKTDTQTIDVSESKHLLELLDTCRWPFPKRMRTLRRAESTSQPTSGSVSSNRVGLWSLKTKATRRCRTTPNAACGRRGPSRTKRSATRTSRQPNCYSCGRSSTTSTYGMACSQQHAEDQQWFDTLANIGNMYREQRRYSQAQVMYSKVSLGFQDLFGHF